MLYFLTHCNVKWTGKMMRSLNIGSSTRKSPEKTRKKVNKIDEHIDQAGIDNLESFLDPSTNTIYYRLKVLGKGGFAKGKFF